LKLICVISCPSPLFAKNPLAIAGLFPRAGPGRGRAGQGKSDRFGGRFGRHFGGKNRRACASGTNAGTACQKVCS
jgi:hypothetical protein